MVLIKDEETKNYKNYLGTAFAFKLSEDKENAFKRKFEKFGGTEKYKVCELKMANFIQRSMHKKSKDLVTGDIWQEDFNEIFTEMKRLVEE